MAGSASDITFGTDGWRGLIADDFTFANVGRVGAALAAHLKSKGRCDLPVYASWGVPCRPAAAGVLVGYDTRFLSRQFALHLARAMVAAGVPACITTSPVPTPALSHAVREGDYACGVVITASHNPPTYNGVKLKPEYGGSATEDITKAVEGLLPQSPPLARDGDIEEVDIVDAYLAALREQVDLTLLGRASMYVVVDAMYGAGQGYAVKLLKEARLPHLAIRSTVDPLFGGKKPEPLEENLIPLRSVIRSMRSRARGRSIVGLVTDGDGDRASAMDEYGTFLDTHRTAALILWHLIRHRGLQGPVVKSFALSDMIRTLADNAGLPCKEVKIGFKWAVEDLVRGTASFAGEESGGYGYAWHLPERDGILTGLLLLELVAQTGKSVSVLVKDLFDEVGPHHYRRLDLTLPERLEVVEQLRKRPPDTLGGRCVTALEDLDGLKLRLDGGWVLFRASGTEPILRIYCEMDDPMVMSKALEEARTLVVGGLPL